MERLIYFNGKFVPEIEAKVSIFDSALMFGDMVFEMTRSFNGKQFKLREHLERLYKSIKYVRIPLEMTIDEMEEKCHETIKVNQKAFMPHDEHRLMINVSRGPLSIYHEIFPQAERGPNVIIADFPLKWTVAGMGELYDRGINAVIPSQRAIPASLLDPKIKNRSRLHYQMANIEVSNWKGDNNWALLLDPDGYIAEGTGDNFFIVKDGIIITPEGRNILRGVSRDTIFEIAKELKLQCIEKNIDPYDVYNADEAFMTGTPFSILPVTGLNGEVIGSGKMGQITKTLIKKWGQNVGVDLIEQIKSFNEETQGTNASAPSPYSFKK
ncbi:aminotransferase class IV [Bacteriovoracales bacterium]|nr:aminotransferase class IV [Bacteriovoracales bacterium]